MNERLRLLLAVLVAAIGFGLLFLWPGHEPPRPVFGVAFALAVVGIGYAHWLGAVPAGLDKGRPFPWYTRVQRAGLLVGLAGGILLAVGEGFEYFSVDAVLFTVMAQFLGFIAFAAGIIISGVGFMGHWFANVSHLFDLRRPRS